MKSFVHSASGPAWPRQCFRETCKHDADDDDCVIVRDAGQQLAQLALAKLPGNVCLHVDSRTAASSGQQRALTSCDLAGVADYILSGKARKIVVMVGAGISVSAGIPDFRTPGTGLYSQLEKFNLPWPEAVFDIRFFRHNPKPFYLLAKELFPGTYMPTPTHFFLRLLHEKGLLLTVFTQNIDGLEQLAGLPAEKVVPAHGSFDGAHCIDCGRAASMYAVQQAVYDDEVATCSSCGGMVKPDIVFFGEPLPARFHRRRLADMKQADLLIVMGTSLLVQPFASMLDAVPEDTPRLLINMNRVGEKKQDSRQIQHLAKHPRTRSYSANSSSDNSSDSEDETGSISGFESDATALTASSSCINFASKLDCSPADGSAATTTPSPSSEYGTSAERTQPVGFDFDAFIRDVALLGTCDQGVMQLAELLGWDKDLHEMIRHGTEEFEAAKQDWDD